MCFAAQDFSVRLAERSTVAWIAGGIAGDAETVIGVLELGGNARSRGASRDFRVVPPRAATRSAAGSRGGTSRIAVGRHAVVVGVEPIRAPFMHIRADAEQAICVALAGR